VDAISEFNGWFQQPILVPAGDPTVEVVLEAINRHPLAQDEKAQDYVMPSGRCKEQDGRFRIYGENQDTWYCLVQAGAQLLSDPPVRFESCLDLTLDHYVDPHEIHDGTVEIAKGFKAFLWYIIASQICFRLESSSYLRREVSGIIFSERTALGADFVNPLSRAFPGGYDVFVGPGTICAPGWGAAFKNQHYRSEFVECYAPKVRSCWA